MAYARLDDVFPEHPKIAALSDRAFRIHVQGICYSAKVLSDGFVPDRVAAGWSGAATRHLLVQSGLWDEVEGGYLIHDYLDYNPSKVSVAETRAAWRDQKVAAGKARAATAGRSAGKFLPADHQRTTSGAAGGIHQPPPLPSPPLVVGVDPVPDTPNAVGNRGGAASSENGKSPFAIDDHQQGILLRLWEQRPGWATELSYGGLVKLMKDHGAGAVNDALEDLIENAGQVQRPYPYLARVAAELASSSTSSTAIRGV
jgi:hypothetical protein